MNFSHHKAHKGFTLIELLVVIAIIGLLSSVVLASLGTARSKARDVQRQSDMKQLRTGLELYYNQYGYYPTYPLNGGVLTDCTGTAYTSMATDLKNLGFMPSIPQDPQYTGSGSGTGFCYRYDNWCNVPSGVNPQYFRMWEKTENSQIGGSNLWWDNYYVGQTNCTDPS